MVLPVEKFHAGDCLLKVKGPDDRPSPGAALFGQHNEWPGVNPGR